jgi:hypothetical protein
MYRIDGSLTNLLVKNVKIKVHRNIFLPVLLNVYEACLVPLREDYRISVAMNRVLCTIFMLQGSSNRRLPTLHDELLNLHI